MSLVWALKKVFLRIVPRCNPKVLKHINSEFLNEYGQAIRRRLVEIQGRVDSKSRANKTGPGNLRSKIQSLCTCKACSMRSIKMTPRLAYYKGFVVVKYDGVSDKHLVANDINWFNDLNGRNTVEDILKEKDEKE
uniref:DNL-type domain-containing protein n=1 Tax=Glossina pallidipes TaxID=7398 RepID=A0A1B0A4H6_GLOPL